MPAVKMEMYFKLIIIDALIFSNVILEASCKEMHRKAFHLTHTVNDQKRKSIAYPNFTVQNENNCEHEKSFHVNLTTIIINNNSPCI